MLCLNRCEYPIYGIFGYFGLYERAYGLTSIPTLFENFLLEPAMVGDLLDIITEYRMKVANKYIEIGFRLCKSGAAG